MNFIRWYVDGAEKFKSAIAKTTVLLAICDERERQDNGKFGKAVNRGYSQEKWFSVLSEEFLEALVEKFQCMAKEVNHAGPDEAKNDAERIAHLEKLRVELIQTAAVAIAWIEALDANELHPDYIDACKKYGSGFSKKESDGAQAQ